MGDPVTGLIIGSCIFLFLGIVAYCVIDNFVKKSFQSNAPKLNSERTLYFENRGFLIAINQQKWCIIPLLLQKQKQMNQVKQKQRKQFNTLITSVIIATIGMWIMWVTCYMHQMYPLITPIPHNHH